MKKNFKIENIQKIVIGLFFYFTYFFNNIYYVQIIDYLNQAYVYKTIKREYFNFFNLDVTIPNFLDGYSYNYLIPSEFHLTSIFEYILGVESSELFFQIGGRLFIIFLSIKIFRNFTKNEVIILTASLYVGLSDFWPIVTPSIIAMVISIYVYFASRDKLTIKNMVLLASLPFLYELQLGGVWILTFAVFIFLNDYIKTKNIKNMYFLVFNSLFIFLANYRFFYEIFLGQETVRSYPDRKLFNFNKFDKFIETFLKVNIEGHWHFSTSIRYFIFPIISIYFLILLYKFLARRELVNEEKIFLKYYLVVQLLNLFYAIDYSQIFDLNELFGLRLHLWRIVIFNQFLNPLLFLLVLKKVKFKTVIILFFFAAFILNGSGKAKIIEPLTFDSVPQPISSKMINFGQKINYVDYLLMTNWNKLLPFLSTYGSPYSSIEEYYQVTSFNSFKSEFKDYNNYKFVSYNLDPMIAGYNGLNIADGYFNLYEKSYNLKFRKVIEKELDYLGSKSSYYDEFGAKISLFIEIKNPSYNLDNINFCELSESIEATHMISSKYINLGDFENTKFLDLIFDNKIFIYEIKTASYC